MILSSNKSFKKDYQRLSPKTIKKFKQRILLFRQDEFNEILNNHSLSGKYQGYRSINVTGDLRAIYKKEGQTVIFVAIDSHSNLYR